MGSLPPFMPPASPGAAPRPARRLPLGAPRSSAMVAQGDAPSSSSNQRETVQEDSLPVEVPVALVYNGVSHAVMLATPEALEDFALGFSLSEGILQSPRELFDCEIQPAPEGVLGIELHLEVASERFLELKARRRALAGRTGCGLCGVEQLQAVLRPMPPLPLPEAGAGWLTPIALARALDALPAHQPLHRRTHAVHGAAWVSPTGEILAVREDVGRHNALDKLIGHLAARGIAGAFASPSSPSSAPTGFVLVTSRASVEMVQKTAAVGLPVLFSLSAPTTLAVALAEQVGLTLVGSVHAGACSLYTHPQRFHLPETES